LASPVGGPALLRQYYKQVPFTSLGWAIFKTHAAPPSALAGRTPTSPLDFSFWFSQPSVVVASVRYFGAVHFKAVAFTGSEDAAQHLTEHLGTLLAVVRAAEISSGSQGPDPDVKQFFESLQLEQHKDRAELTANLPPALIRKLVAEAPREVAPQAEPQAPSSTQPDGGPKARHAPAASGKPATPAVPPH